MRIGDNAVFENYFLLLDDYQKMIIIFIFMIFVLEFIDTKINLYLNQIKRRDINIPKLIVVLLCRILYNPLLTRLKWNLIICYVGSSFLIIFICELRISVLFIYFLNSLFDICVLFKYWSFYHSIWILNWINRWIYEIQYSRYAIDVVDDVVGVFCSFCFLTQINLNLNEQKPSLHLHE
jgi:hypothetical protein